MQLGTEPLYLHLFIYFPFHRVRWLAASFIFRRSALFFHLCHVFSVILLSIFAVRRGGGGGGGRVCVREREAAAAVYSRHTTVVLRIFSGPSDAGDAAEGSRYPAESAIFCAVFSAVRAPVLSRLCESKERLSEGRKRDRGRGVG
ncbi:hypothetical protein GOODEAATRI_013753 [Goodea atripinnis]|uniref:Uncharacterized protein n=1 Tax=Goodea atripinnis TaxID=208336 RepID=A0ABV0PDW4_9TELE